jgi:hypothetical protein
MFAGKGRGVSLALVPPPKFFKKKIYLILTTKKINSGAF